MNKPLLPVPSSHETSLAEHLPDDKVRELVEQVKDYQITHGSLIKLVQAELHSEDEDEATLESSTRGGRARTVPMSLIPSSWPRRLFQEAVRLQQDFNELYLRLAADEDLLGQLLDPLLQNDEFARVLWEIHQEAKRAGFQQSISMGIFRSDYMVHTDELSRGALRQVEFNTFSVAGGVHGIPSTMFRSCRGILNSTR